MHIENSTNLPNTLKSNSKTASADTAKFELNPEQFAETEIPGSARENQSDALAKSDIRRGISMDQLTPINVANLEQITAPLDMVERLHKMLTRIFSEPNIPQEGTYAEVRAGGKVVAKILNGGGVETSNAANARIQKLFTNEFAEGPELAVERARKIAEAFGGTIELATTAQTQKQWQNRPPTTWSIDSTMMAQHGYDVQKDLMHKQYATADLAADAITAFIQSKDPDK